MRLLRLVAFVALISATLAAQDAVTTLPAHYKVTFENDHVRVTRVHYPAHAKLPGHTHTSLPTAYVYLTDSGPVAFTHVGEKAFSATRPPTVARSYRLFRGLQEVHTVENLSDMPSEFLRVEFKTEVVGDPRTLRGKFLPPPPTANVLSQQEFENPQVRITRVTVPKGQSAAVAASEWPSVLIALASTDLGRAIWLPTGQTHHLHASEADTEVLRFELKTPVRATR